MTTKRTVCSLHILLFALPVPVFAQQEVSQDPGAPLPKLSCTILNPLEGSETLPHQPINVSNLKLVDLEVSLAFPGSRFQAAASGVIPTGYELPVQDLWVAGIGNAPDTLKAPTIEIVVAKLSAGNHQVQVPIKITYSGEGADLDRLYLHVSLEIPIEKHKRSDNIQRYLQQVESEASQGRTVDDNTLREFRERRERMPQMFDGLYYENEAGQYEIQCAYSSHRPGFWTAELHAVPIRINVVYQGNFFDQPGFQGQPGSEKVPGTSESQKSAGHLPSYR